MGTGVPSQCSLTLPATCVLCTCCVPRRVVMLRVLPTPAVLSMVASQSRPRPPQAKTDGFGFAAAGTPARFQNTADAGVSYQRQRSPGSAARANNNNEPTFLAAVRCPAPFRPFSLSLLTLARSPSRSLSLPSARSPRITPCPQQPNHNKLLINPLPLPLIPDHPTTRPPDHPTLAHA